MTTVAASARRTDNPSAPVPGPSFTESPCQGVPFRFSFEWFRLAAAAVFVTMGCGHLLGPAAWRSSSSYDVIRQVPGGLRTWGAVFLLIGTTQAVCILRRYCELLRLSMIVGAGVAMAWAMSFVAAALIGSLAGVGGPALWAFFSLAQAGQARRLARHEQ